MKKNFPYTKGPWKARNIVLNNWVIEGASPHVEGKCQRICEMNGPWKPENYKANARLIEASPEMYEILVRLSEALKRKSYPELQGVACETFEVLEKIVRKRN